MIPWANTVFGGNEKNMLWRLLTLPGFQVDTL